uniref:Uncharacterized protein n=1 Tax=Anopheles maculatus TaxID=74869 RepID=A0A182T197_9DIPT
MSFPGNDEELFDQNFEETIKSAAVKNNLTPMCVKKLLKVKLAPVKIVVNDHVFAMVRLKEEEETKKITGDENSQTNNKGEEDDFEKDEPEPKLTRLKAKQLKQTPFPIASLNEPVPDDEVAALILQELGSDDDDEEYRPAEDETASDDDPNTTVSDIDSQPRTPMSTTAAVEQDHESTGVRYTKDGLFKIPKPRNDSQCSLSEQEQEQENIALRTRSKLCLTTTAIETIESTFIPPDITNDMYEYDGEMDQAWKDFLEEFTKPLLDPEEMRAVNVSKKELNELIMELMEMGGTDDSMLEQTLTETINESLNCRIEDRSEMLSTPVPTQEIDYNDSGAVQSAVTGAVQAEQFPSMPSLPPPPPEPSTNQPNGTTQPQLVSPQNGFNSAMFTPIYMPPQPNQNMPTVVYNSTPVMNVTLNSTQPIPLTRSDDGNNQQEQQTCNPIVADSGSSKSRFFVKSTYLEEITPEDHTEPPDSNSSDWSKSSECSEPRYRANSTTVPIDVNVSETVPGMHDFQFLLLHQQLRMHVQLTAQHFIQTYAHLVLKDMAPTFKNMLTELEEIGKTKPNIVPWNLSAALECCRSWEQELAEDSSNRKALTKYWTDEIAREEELQSVQRVHHSDFHWLVREKILNCKAFLYPSLLPYKAFRSCWSSRTTLTNNSEKHLIAMWLERGYKELSKKNRKLTKSEVCSYVAKHYYIKHSPTYFKLLVYKQQTRPGTAIEVCFALDSC